MKKPFYIMVDMTGQTAVMRGVIAGVARFCNENPHVKLRFPSIEWALVGDPEHVDGVIAVVSTDDPRGPATRFGKPVVNVSSIFHPVPFPTVTMDNTAIGKVAAEHLVLQGYRHFAYHLESRVYYSRQRLAGFRKALEKRNHECHVFDSAPPADAVAPEHADEARAELRRRTLEWLVGLPKPLGLFTHNDVRAAMLMDICRQGGLSIPNDVGVLGVDNDELIHPFTTPPLSDIDVAADIIGYRAAELIVALIAGAEPPGEPILIAPRRLVERPSTQPQFIDDEHLAAAMQMIRQSTTRPVSVGEILQAVPLARRTLERRFRERFGTSPVREIRRVQLARARELLLNTNQTLSRVATTVGYRRFRNFATAFKKETGMGPSAYRRKYRPSS